MTGGHPIFRGRLTLFNSHELVLLSNATFSDGFKKKTLIWGNHLNKFEKLKGEAKIYLHPDICDCLGLPLTRNLQSIRGNLGWHFSMLVTWTKI